jgi:hypothetical protein
MPPPPFPEVPWSSVAAVLAALCGILLVATLVLSWRVRRLAALLDDETFRNRSLSTTYGRITEQWIPLSNRYPYDRQHFRFLGSPIDGVQFEEDRIVFIEFKANRSRLSDTQRRIKRLIEAGEVYWDEFHFTDEE